MERSEVPAADARQSWTVRSKVLFVVGIAASGTLRLAESFGPPLEGPACRHR
jgi:hypothetical protein